MRLARTLTAACAAALLLPATAAAKDYFDPAEEIHLPAFGSTSGAAGVYPSAITVGDATGPITAVTVRLGLFTHQRPKDLDVLLVGPQGQKVMLMSDAGGTEPANPEDPEDLVFSSTATTPIPADATPLSNTPYRPTDAHEAGEPEPDVLPGPAPVGPYGTDLGVFHGADANGEWRLFASDDTSGNVGRLDDGWTLSLTYGTGGTADLSLAVTDSPDPAATGQDVTYAATVSNATTATATATGVSLEMTLAGLDFKSIAGGSCTGTRCDLPPIAPGASVQVSLVATMNRADGAAVFTEVGATNDPEGATWTEQTGNPDYVPADRPLIPAAEYGPPLPERFTGSERAEEWTHPPVAAPGPARKRKGRGPARIVDLRPPLFVRGEATTVTDVVRAGARRSARAKVTYLLSADRRRGRGDLALKGTRRVPALKPGREHTGSARLRLPAKAKPGRHHLLACLARHCRAAEVVVAPKAQPLDVAVTDAPGAAARTIGPGGGTLTVAAGDGTRYELDLPGGALDRSTLVRLVPTQSLAPFPLGRLVAGVRIEPGGRGLARAATLRITPARTEPDVTGFGFRDLGKDLHLRPVGRDGGLWMDVTRFDGFGIAAATAAQRAAFWTPPARDRMRARAAQVARASGRVPAGREGRHAQLVQTMASEGRQTELLRGDYKGDLPGAFNQSLDSWYADGIEPMLKRAVTDAEWYTVASTELLQWERQIELLGADGFNRARRAAAHALLRKAIMNAVKVFQARCAKAPTPQDGERLLSAFNAWTIFIGDTEADPRDPAVLVNCNRYELRMDRRAEEDMHGDCSLKNGVGSGGSCAEHPTDWWAQVRATVELRPRPGRMFWQISGGGPLEYVAADFRQRNGGCTYDAPVFSGERIVMVDTLAPTAVHPNGDPRLGTRMKYAVTLHQGEGQEKLGANCGQIDSCCQTMMMHTQSWYWLHARERTTSTWKHADDPRDPLCTGPWMDKGQRYTLEGFVPGPGDVVGRYDLRGAVTIDGDKCWGTILAPYNTKVNFIAEGTIDIVYRGVPTG